ncbi:MAG: DUF11 domain-containing protein [Sphingobacteriales bacterium]|nr:MAG: DUF11 domain-containing protein [Sphingobacteriales bacterium]
MTETATRRRYRQYPDTDPDNDTNGGNDVSDNSNGDEDDHDTETIEVYQEFDLALIKQLSPGQSSLVNQGDIVNYTLTVYNQGTLTATNVTITDYIPVGMTLSDANWTDNGDGTASYTIAGPIAQSTSTTVTIALQVGATFQGTSLTNMSEISEAYDGDGNPGDDIDSTPDTNPDNDTNGGNDVTDNSNGDEDDHDPETIEVHQEFDLALIKQLSPGQSSLVNQGDIVNYTLTVYNQGTLTATNVTITDYIPVGMTLADANWTDNGDGTASYTIAGPIAQSTSTTVTIALQVGATFQGTSLTNVSEISEAYDGDGNPGDDIDSTPDTDPDNDTNGGNDVSDNSNGDEDDHDTETIEVYQEFDLALIKQLSPGQSSLVNQGDIVNYTLTVYNQGTLTATNVTITDYIPVGMTLSDANWTDNGDGTASYTIAGPIAQSTSTTVTIALQVGATFQGTSLTNVSEISEAYDGDGNPGDDIDSTPDTNPDNDTNGGNDVTDNSNGDEDDHDPETIEVHQEFDLALIKQLSGGQPSLVNQGDIVNYTLTVYNQGTLTATNVTITDYIPVGMTLSDANWTDNGDGTASYTIAGPIAQSTSTTVTIALQVGATFQGTSLTNVSEISEAYDGDGNPGDDIDSTPDTNPDNDTNGGNDVTDNSNGDEDDHDPETIEVYQEFDLALIKQLSPGQPSLVNQGDIVNYTLTVYNQGTLTATNVTITDYIPVGMTLSDANWTDNGDGTASYTIAGPIAQSTSTTVTISLQVGATFQGTSLTNVSEISEAYDGDGNPGDDIDSTPDTNPDNDTNGGNDVTDNSNGDEDDHDTETIEVHQEFDLALIKQLSGGQPSVVNQGDIVNFTITIFNQGTLDAFNVAVVDYIPDGMDLVDSNWSPGTGNMANYNTLLSIPAGESVSINIALQVFDTFEGASLTNYAEVTGADNIPDYPDIDSTPDSEQGNDIVGGDNVIDNSNEDEDDHDYASVGVNQTFDLALIKTLADGQPSTVSLGDDVEFTITVFNQGTLTATNVQINDYLLGSMTLNDSDWSMVSGTIAHLNTPISEIAPGDSYSVNITLTVNSNFQFNVATNRAEIASADNALGLPDIDSTPDDVWDNDLFGGDNITDNTNGDEDDSDPAPVNVLQTFDLALIKQLSPGQVTTTAQGETVNFSITIFNQGTLDAFNVVITDYFPDGFELTDAAWTLTGANSATYNTPVTVPVGQSVVINIALRVSDTFEGNQLINFAEISDAENGLNYPDVDSTPDTDPLNDTIGGDDIVDNTNNDQDDHDYATIEVYQEFDLALIKQLADGQSDEVAQGETATFTITVFNQGTLSATLVAITDYIPEGMILADANWTDNGNGTASYVLPDLIAPGNSAQVNITLMVEDGFEGITVTNFAEISGAKDGQGTDVVDIDSSPDTYLQNDIVGGDNIIDNTNNDEDDHDFAPIGIIQVFDLALIKQLANGQASTVALGETITFTITVFNQGTLTANNVTLTDYIPAGTTLADSDWTNNGNGTASYTLPGSIAPGATATADITLMVNPSFTGGDLTNYAEISNADNAVDYPDEDSTHDTNPNNDVEGGNDLTDNSNGDEDDHDGEAFTVCNIALVTINTLCDDNGTGASADDLFTFTISPSGIGLSGTYGIVGDVNASGLDYSIEQQFGPFAISNGDLNFVIADEATGGCIRTSYVVAPEPCSTCAINGVSVQINCTDNTTGNPADDLFTFTLNPFGIGLGGSYSLTGDVVAQGVAYGSESNPFGPYDISGGDLSITITDDAESTCALNVVVEAPLPCSTCAIVQANEGVYCDDNNTGASSDDLFYFTLNPVGVGLASTYNISGATTATGLAYGTPQVFGPFPISGGDLTITITDGIVGGCTHTLTIFAPEPCSTCTLEDADLIVYCNDNGTGTSSDDLFYITLNPTGTGLGATYNISGDISATGIAYGLSNTFGLYPISGGILNITLTDSAAAEDGCSLDLEVTPPDPCSTCELSGANATVQCDDNNTGTPSDDVFYITLNPDGIGLGSTYSLSGDVIATGVAYDSPQEFGPFPISGGNLNITLTDNAAAADGCTLDFLVTAPAPCSTCSIESANIEVQCDDNNTGISTDDMYYFTMAPTGSGLSSTYHISGSFTAANVPYGNVQMFGPFAISDGDLSITITDNDVNGCTFEVIVTAPEPCSIPVYDLALVKTLAPGQTGSVISGAPVNFALTVYNQGDVPVQNIQLIEYIPEGLILNDPDWSDNGNGTASFTMFEILNPGQSASVQISFTTSVQTPTIVVNRAEIIAAEDMQGNPIVDEDSNFDTDPDNDTVGGNNFINNENNDEDDHDYENINVMVPPCNLGNFVWHDLNQNGVQDPGEPGIHNVLVSLYTADGWLAATQYTNVAGSYLFVDLAPGSYYVVFSTPSDASGTLMIPTLHNVGDDYLDSDADPVTGQTQTVTLVPGETNLSIDAGYYMEEPPILLGSIGDFVWLDQNQNGQQNAGEPGISGVWVTLYNASTNSIVSITTTDINGYYLFSDLPAGNYYVVFGTPTGHTPSPANSGNDATDSDAGPGGQTSVIVLAPGENNLTVDAGFYIETPPVLLGSLGDYVWLDQNQNGQQDSGEQGIAGVDVTLYNAATNTFVSTTVTNANGFYLFSNLPAGNYYVVFGTPTGHTPSPANSGNDATDSDAGTGGQTNVIVLAPGENNLTIDAGFFIDTPPNLASLGDFVWLDANENGQQDVGEQGISGVAVTLYNAATNTFVSTTVTNANGFYLFSNLPAGNYYVVFGTPTGHTASPTNVGNDVTDSDAGIGGQTTVITLAPGENNLTIDAGFYIDGPPALLGSIGDYVWFDQNQNGQQNSGEPGIGGVTVMLFNAATNTVIATTTTNPSGYYLFNNLVAGSYYVVFVTPLGYSSAPANTGNDATDSDALTGGQTNVINLAPGENNLTIDAGFTLPGAISGTLWVDLNQNNTINPTEPLLSGVTVVLIDNNGNVIATTVTDVNGFYQFTGLVPGNYTVQVPQVVPTPTGNVILNTPNNLTVTVIAGQTSTNNNFGYIPPAVLSDVVWLDINGNCILETNEEGLAGIELIVYNSLGQQVATVVTGVNGSFTINNLPAGIYTVTVVATTLPDGTQISQGSITYDMATGEVLFAENFCVTEDDIITPCTHPDLFLCTEPMTPLTICPEFCLPDGWTFSSVQTTYNCSLVMLDDCIQYTPLPLFAGTDVITIVACYNGVCETQIVHVTVGDCTPPPCESFVLDICTAPMTPVVVCPEFCLSGSYQITQTSTMFNCSIQFLSNGCLQYTALPGFIGSDMIQVIACNEALECDTAIINITVTSNGICGEPNQPPVAVDDEADVENGSSVTIPVLVNDYDPDGDAFSITTHTPPANGTVSLVGNQFIYTPNEGFEGTDVFTYQICDTEGACDMATVTIDVIIPCTEVTMICTQPLTPVVICPEFCNIPNGTITIIQANTTYNCSLYSLGGGCLQYTALPLFAGQETITITGCNQFGVCETITITVNVTEDCDEVGMAPYSDNTNPDNADQKVLIGTDNGALLVNLALLEMKPVPATDYLDIMFNTVKGTVLMEVTDLSGRVIFSQQLNATEGINNYRLPVFDYATGIYLVSLKSGEAKVSGKFVKH